MLNVTVVIAHTYSPLNVTANAPVVVNVTNNHYNHYKYIPSVQSAVDASLFSYIPTIDPIADLPEYPPNQRVAHS